MRNNMNVEVTHEGTLGSNRVPMRFSNDAAGRAHLMALLTDLYSDKEAAVLREIACNARDAQVEAGYGGPVEVTTPTRMMPFLEITDHGVGMSVDFINGTYSEFGGSTKRDTDDQVGFWGIGGKSPLTLTNQFTLVTVHNGVRTTVLVSRSAEGDAGVEVIDTAATDAPNGTRIKIPIEDVNGMNRKIEQFFRWWPVGSVLIDGEKHAPPAPTEALDPWIEVHHGLDSDIVIMGDVAYPVTHSRNVSAVALKHDYRVAIRVPMGAVNVTPSRDALRYTPLTLETLGVARNWISERTHRVHQREIEAEQTIWDAHSKAMAIQRYSRSQYQFTWRGHKLPINGNLSLPDKPSHISRSEWEGRYVWSYCALRNSPKGHIQTPWIRVEQLRGAYVIEGYPNKTLGKSVQAKIDQWLKDNKISLDTTILLDRAIARFDPWVPPEHRVPWSVVSQYKGASGQTGSGPDHYPFVVHEGGLVREKQQPVPPKGRLVYFSNTDDERAANDRYATEMISDYLSRCFPGVHVVRLPRNRWDKFRRENPRRALHVSEFLDKVEAGLDKLPDSQKFMIAVGYDFVNHRLGRIIRHAGKVDDPDLREFLQSLVVTDDKARKRYNACQSIRRRLGLKGLTFEQPKSILDKLRELEERYPLSSEIDQMYRKGTDHLLEYVNALYLYRQHNPTEEA